MKLTMNLEVMLTILNGLRHQKEMDAQGHSSGPADSMPQGPTPTAPTHTS